MALRAECITWDKLRDAVDKLTQDNNYLTPYSEYEFLDKIKRSANIRRFRESKKYTLQCHVVYNGDDIVLIAPLLVSVKLRKIYLLGEFSSVGHLDFIYGPKAGVSEISRALDLVFDNYAGYEFCCDRISQFSLTKEVFDVKQILPISRDISVKLDFTDSVTW